MTAETNSVDQGETEEGGFLILSRKPEHNRPGLPLSWWRDGGDYTRYVDEAERFTRESCVADHRLHGHPLTQAVPVGLVLSRAERAEERYGNEVMRRPGARVVHRRSRRKLDRDWLTTPWRDSTGRAA